MNNKLPAICLCLPDRKNNWTKLQKECEQSNIEFTPFLIGKDWIDDPNITVDDWCYGTNNTTKKRHKWAFLAHMEILKKAYNAGWPYFLLLEDDCSILINRFKHWYPVIKENYLDKDFDLFYIGWWQDEDNYLQKEQQYQHQGIMFLSKIHGFVGGAHGLIINRDFIPELLTLKAVDPMDSQINRTIGHSNIKSYMCSPKLCHVNTQWSFCEESEIKRYMIKDDN